MAYFGSFSVFWNFIFQSPAPMGSSCDVGKSKTFFFTPPPRSPAGRVNNSSRIRGGAIHVCCRQRVSSCTAIPGSDRRALAAGPKTTTSHLTVMAEESPPGRFGVFLSVATLALLAAGSPISGEWQLRVSRSDLLPCWSRPHLEQLHIYKSLNNSCRPLHVIARLTFCCCVIRRNTVLLSQTGMLALTQNVCFLLIKYLVNTCHILFSGTIF